jgi:predicted ATPase/class 3 adenylate cyclase/predicted TIM-barrel fold metal-dependent hydrolase
MSRLIGSPRPLPSGNVTFLFTDIVGSTQLWELAPDAMRRGLARHDEILHKTLDRNGGIVFKTVGDSFFAVFEDPVKALHAATETQYALIDEPWPRALGDLRVRIGLSTGTPVLRGRDYFGPTVNRVARLAAAARGGQILVSDATASLVAGKIGNVRLHDLGMHRLRDLTEPERIYQATAPGLPSELLTPASLDATPNNLPSHISSFVGRSDDLKLLQRLIHKHPLVTIVGLGGMGKSRLALQLAEDLVGEFADGCWFVSLKDIDDPAQIVQATADALHLRRVVGEPVESTLLEHLFDSKALIVVDSAEHLIAGVAGFLRRLLASSTGVRLIVTSREPLHIPGEQLLRLGPIEEAVPLFFERVQSLGKSLDDSPESAKAVSNVCAKLQGIPLAIELAAARVASMSVIELDESLTSQLHPLSKSGERGLESASLDAMLDWSYRLLKPSEKRFLMRLAIFDGSFALEAAEAVAGDGLRGEALSLLGSLSDKSLVTYAIEAGFSRYYLFDVVREFALERLRETGDVESHRRHCIYFFGLVRSLTAPALSREVSTARLTTEWSNIRGALRFALEDGHDLEAGHWAVRKLSEFWITTGRTTEGWYWINRALQETDVPPHMRSEMLEMAAKVASIRSDFQALDMLGTLLVEINEESGDPRALGNALQLLANAKVGLGNADEAEHFLRRSLEQFRLADNPRGAAQALANLGLIAGQQHLNFPAASQLLRHSLKIFRELDMPLNCAEVLGNLSVVSTRTGEFAQALNYGRESLAILKRLGNDPDAGMQHINIAEIYMEWEKFEAAVPELQAARDAFGDRANPLYLAYYYEAAFKLAVDLKVHEAAALIYGYASHHRIVIRNPLQPNERAMIDSRLARLTRVIGNPLLERLTAEGASMEPKAMEGVIASLGSSPGQPSGIR